MLSEISKREKDKYHRILLICGIQKNMQTKPKLVDSENRLVVVRDKGWGVGDSSLKHLT